MVFDSDADDADWVPVNDDDFTGSGNPVPPPVPPEVAQEIRRIATYETQLKDDNPAIHDWNVRRRFLALHGRDPGARTVAHVMRRWRAGLF